jgi:hypothetical protein
MSKLALFVRLKAELPVGPPAIRAGEVPAFKPPTSQSTNRAVRRRAASRQSPN